MYKDNNTNDESISKGTIIYVSYIPFYHITDKR